MMSTLDPPALMSQLEVAEEMGSEMASSGVATAAKWPDHRRCRLASACAAVKDPPEPIAISDDRPAVRTAWRRAVMSHEIAQENVSASLDISVP